MPRRDDIKSILLIGSGPIVIGQACEFDYSGTQGAKALKEEGYRVILVNSNPATIMTDPEFADRTYVEPLTPEIVEAIIAREKPDAVLPTLGGQTALNLALALADRGILEKYGVRADRREGRGHPQGRGARALQGGDGQDRARTVPARKSLAPPKRPTRWRSASAFRSSCGRRSPWVAPAAASLTTRRSSTRLSSGRSSAAPFTSASIEESLLGWKEFELEVIRDTRGQLQRHLHHRELRPDGRAHRRLDHGRARDDAHRPRVPAPARRGASDHHRDWRRDRRLEHPIRGQPRRWAPDRHRNEPARVALERARLEGDGLSDREDRGASLPSATASTSSKTTSPARAPRSSRPSTTWSPRCPRFAFEKFAGADPRLTTQMKSVGEAMAIGRTFKESLQKAGRSLETGRDGLDLAAFEGRLPRLGRPSEAAGRDWRGHQHGEAHARRLARPE